MQPINMIMIYNWDKRHKIDCISWKLIVPLAEKMHFLQDLFQMTTIELVCVINFYHINGLHLFWDIL